MEGKTNNRGSGHRVRLTEAEQRVLRQLVEFLQSSWPIEEVKVFGSRVTGSADAESDLDVFICLNCPVDEDTRRQVVHWVFEANLHHGTNLSILLVSSEEWQGGPLSYSPIHLAIEEEGVPV